MKKLFILSFLFFMGCSSEKKSAESNQCWACTLMPENLTVVLQPQPFRQLEAQMKHLSKVGCKDFHRVSCE